jgi:Family of unknown function (DUF5681)
MVWKKGQSGNPSGRPPMSAGERAYVRRLRIVGHQPVTMYDEIGEKIISARKRGRPTNKENQQLKEHSRTVSNLERVAEVVYEEAIKGERWAIEHLADRLDGKI